MFFLNALLLGVGLAMDAFSVSVANGFNEPNLKLKKSFSIAGTFSFFQFVMPLIGWFCVHFVLEQFKIFEHFIPWIALLLLSFIGGKMVVSYIKDRKNNTEQFDFKEKVLGFGTLIVQGIATSIDALSVGFTIAEYDFLSGFVCAVIIAVVTLIICLLGVFIGKKFGTLISKKAELFGGVILILIGLEIFVKGMISLYC